jgi:hypothetical protein
MPDQTEIVEEETPFTDTGTGLYSPPPPVTIDNSAEDEGPTGAVPGPPREVTTYDFPYDSEGNLMPTAKPVSKQVTSADVEDKSVKAPRKARG